MVRLVDDLLDVSRITRNKLELRKERVDAGGGRPQRRRDEPPADRAGRAHVLASRCPPTPVYLDADLTRLAQVFSNLLNNAAKYTEPGGRISLTGRTERGRGRGAGAGQRAGHPRRRAAPHLRDVLAGGPQHGAGAGRAGDRPDAGAAAGRDARRHGRGPQRRAGPGQRVRRPAAGRRRRLPQAATSAGRRRPVGDGEATDPGGGRQPGLGR